MKKEFIKPEIQTLEYDELMDAGLIISSEYDEEDSRQAKGIDSDFENEFEYSLEF